VSREPKPRGEAHCGGGGWGWSACADCACDNQLTCGRESRLTTRRRMWCARTRPGMHAGVVERQVSPRLGGPLQPRLQPGGGTAEGARLAYTWKIKSRLASRASPDVDAGGSAQGVVPIPSPLEPARIRVGDLPGEGNARDRGLPLPGRGLPAVFIWSYTFLGFRSRLIRRPRWLRRVAFAGG
jgi:hypothetical protein